MLFGDAVWLARSQEGGGRREEGARRRLACCGLQHARGPLRRVADGPGASALCPVAGTEAALKPGTASTTDTAGHHRAAPPRARLDAPTVLHGAAHR